MNKLLATTISLATLISSSFASQDPKLQNVQYFSILSGGFTIGPSGQIEKLTNYQHLLGELKQVDKNKLQNLKDLTTELKNKILQDIKDYDFVFGFDFTVTLDMNKVFSNTLEIKTEYLKILKDLKDCLPANKPKKVNNKKNEKKDIVYQLLNQYLVSSSEIEDMMNEKSENFQFFAKPYVLKIVKTQLENEIAENIGRQICLQDIPHINLEGLIKNKIQYKKTLKNLILSSPKDIKDITSQIQPAEIIKTEANNGNVEQETYGDNGVDTVD